MIIDIADHRVPKRGDLVHTNIGDRRERTWLVLRVRRIKGRSVVPRYSVFMARWWGLEADMRLRLFRSAERHGGQQLFLGSKYKTRKKQSFEQYIARKRPREDD